uniref:Uncharacterized protein n=1 Tax=Parastrongyloides trichosuri TaxID=131310 RepID=A0A0N4ZR50_PARTI
MIFISTVLYIISNALCIVHSVLITFSFFQSLKEKIVIEDEQMDEKLKLELEEGLRKYSIIGQLRMKRDIDNEFGKSDEMVKDKTNITMVINAKPKRNTVDGLKVKREDAIKKFNAEEDLLKKDIFRLSELPTKKIDSQNSNNLFDTKPSNNIISEIE